MHPEKSFVEPKQIWLAQQNFSVIHGSMKILFELTKKKKKKKLLIFFCLFFFLIFILFYFILQIQHKMFASSAKNELAN